jgi:hypothetical protein
MSSILEALRELESTRAPAADRAATPVLPPPAPAPQGTGFFMQTMAGLAVGALVFGGYLLVQRVVVPRPGDATPSRATPAPPVVGLERPAWLDQVEPPQARVDRKSSEPARRPEPAPASAPSGPAGASSAAVQPSESRPSRPARQVEVEAIHYSGVVSQRSATMRLNGRRVTLGQRESSDGVEVQLITPDGVYVQRGGDVFLVTPSP